MANPEPALSPAVASCLPELVDSIKVAGVSLPAAGDAAGGDSSDPALQAAKQAFYKAEQ